MTSWSQGTCLTTRLPLDNDNVQLKILLRRHCQLVYPHSWSMRSVLKDTDLKKANVNLENKNLKLENENLFPGGARTHDLLLQRHMLYH